jgi:peptidyl-prolyl cis-trans isomerase D
MLRGIHKASSTWLGRGIMAVIMGGLVISFAIWGIGDIFRGFGLNSAIKIGGTEISTEQFRQFYSDRLQQIGRQLGRPITPDQARARGIDRQILGQLVAETTLDEKAAPASSRSSAMPDSRRASSSRSSGGSRCGGRSRSASAAKSACRKRR